MNKAKTDANQQQIVDALRGMGASVFCTHRVGQGFPDLVCAWRGVNYLMEVKMPEGRLTRAEQEFVDNWQAIVYIVRSPEDAIAVLMEE